MRNDNARDTLDVFSLRQVVRVTVQQSVLQISAGDYVEVLQYFRC